MQKTLGVKADIMNVAEKLFCRFGFNKISMDRIAKESKHAKGSVYYHFSSKINLMNSILESELEKIRTDLLAIINDNTMSEPEKIKRYALVRMESMNNRYSYHNVLKNRVLESGDKQLMECFSKVHDALVTWEKEQLTAIIVSGKNKGVFRPEIDASKYVNSLIMMLSSLEFPFFIFNLYDKYKNSFDYMIDEIIFKPLETI
ncbi:MAG: TetR/AcrR family transcriptional regulator [Bacteroidales bacterium]|nr:TetR/AcrR family transcriptional regulator [Bacteroidales bacterium]MBR4584251.1 TetR/AcrR family transcriptional regulator [Bacteroidales bacterium]